MFKKIYLLVVFILTCLILIGAYYFLPKTRTRCGSALPIACQKCTCNRGFIYSPRPIGGAGDMKCFLGEDPICGGYKER